ncbi:hypothetical protein A1019T_01587 [Psychrobacter pasteurii]|uniref:Uncharacterized protein n=1 Tax=Psychrobacter pasteurii TaxID=1945520 RepID=A0A1R4EGK5_9GAMM|nr:hypothetical protein [Psychrobacter pasteurii]SJM37608.1 hypothetical protein A1019T_01587 [Psychrobacter pasteurii]
MTNNKPADPVENGQANAKSSLTGNGKNPYRRSALTKLFLISAVGVGLSLISSAKLAATNLADKKNQDSIKPQILAGKVTKSLEQFSFTTEQGVQYHIADPSHILDDLAKKRGVVDGFYTLNRVRVKALISKVGNYGHMGYYERQVTIVGIADS